MADEVVRLSTDREIAVARVVGEPRPAGRVNLDPGCIGVNEEVVFVVLSCGDTSFSMVDQYVDPSLLGFRLMHWRVSLRPPPVPWRLPAHKGRGRWVK